MHTFGSRTAGMWAREDACSYQVISILAQAHFGAIIIHTWEQF